MARPCQVQQLGRGPRERLPECQSPTQPHIRTGHRALFQGYIRCRCPETLQHLQGRLSTFWIPIQAWEHGPGLVCHATYVRKIHWFIVNLFSSIYQQFMLPCLGCSIDLFSAMVIFQPGSCKIYRKTSASYPPDYSGHSI